MRRVDRPAYVSTPAYATLQIVSYWVSASSLCGLFALGFYMTDLAKGAPGKTVLINLHKSLGLTATLVVAWRVVIHVSRVVPSSTPGLYCWETELARITYRLLYMCMVVMPVSGYLGSSFNPYGTRFQGAPLPPWGWVDSALQHMFYTVYSTTADLLLYPVVLHVAGAIKHQWVDERRCVQRILPGQCTRVL